MTKFKLKHKEDGSEKELSDQDIQRLKNFEAVRSSYDMATKDLHRKKLYKNPKLFMGLLLALIILYLIWEFS